MTKVLPDEHAGDLHPVFRAKLPADANHLVADGVVTSPDVVSNLPRSPTRAHVQGNCPFARREKRQQ